MIKVSTKNAAILGRDLTHGNIASKGWEYKKVKFQVGDTMYEGIVNVGLNEKGKNFHDINNIKEASHERTVDNDLRISGSASNNTSLSQNKPVVNTNISKNSKNDTKNSKLSTDNHIVSHAFI